MPKDNTSSQLVKLVETSADIELFHDQMRKPFAKVRVDGHYEIWPCRSKYFKHWLAHRYWLRHGRAIPNAMLDNAMNLIEAEALFRGRQFALQNRNAAQAGFVFYDLADPLWRSIKITRDGWFIQSPPILFRRYTHQAPQVEPISGGSLDEVFRIVRLKDKKLRLLFMVHLVTSLIPDIPHPIAVFYGPAGSGKTTAGRVFRRLADPSVTETLTFPNNVSELAQQLAHHSCSLYDNITRIPEWLSDALCRAVTGDGFSKRELYSDDDDVIFQFRRSVALTGINIAPGKPDLLDRCILYPFEPLAKDERRPEAETWTEFNELLPQILGAALDVLVMAMNLEPDMKLDQLPRMADFARWGATISIFLGHPIEEFMDALDENISSRTEEVVDSNVVSVLIRELVREKGGWEGTPTELWGLVKQRAAAASFDVRYLPQRS
jgi:hypothetical protein